MKDDIKGAVASSKATVQRLEYHGIKVFDLNEVATISVYIDGADESDDGLNLIKGGGGALTREKIVAAVADQFIFCLILFIVFVMIFLEIIQPFFVKSI